MTSISRSEGNPSPRRKEARSQNPQGSPANAGKPESSGVLEPDSTGEPPQTTPPTPSAAETTHPEPPEGCLTLELCLRADVLAAFDETAAELDEDDPGAARELIAIEALTGHLAELGYEFEEAEDEDDCEEEDEEEEGEEHEESDEAKSEPEPKPKGRYRVLEEVTLDPEVLFDIGTEVDCLISILKMLDPVTGLLDTAEGMAYPDDVNGRRGLDRLGIWTRKLFGVDLEDEMPEGKRRDSEDVYREAMLIPEMVRDAVRHRLERLSVFVGMVQGYEAQ